MKLARSLKPDLRPPMRYDDIPDLAAAWAQYVAALSPVWSSPGVQATLAGAVRRALRLTDRRGMSRLTA